MITMYLFWYLNNHDIKNKYNDSGDCDDYWVVMIIKMIIEID
jgi:hypothetical protein